MEIVGIQVNSMPVRISILMSLCLSAGCSLVPGSDKVEAAVGAAKTAGLSDRRSYNDMKAETLLALPCDISIGAFYRLANSVQQEALAMLCSGRRTGESEPQLVGGGSAFSQ